MKMTTYRPKRRSASFRLPRTGQAQDAEDRQAAEILNFVP
jgi:hypothetical protein